MAVPLTNSSAWYNESSIPPNPYAEGTEHPDISLILSQEVIRYVFPIIILFGTIGNVLSILVLYRKAMQRNCSSTYLIMLAVTDMAVLYLSCFKTWLRIVTGGYEMLHINSGMCKTIKYLFFTSTHLSAWFIVLLTCERFLVVCFPFRASRYWIVHRPWIITLVTIGIIMLININYFWTSELIVIRKTLKCVVFEHDTLMCTVFPILNMFIYSFLPAGIVFSFNMAIIATIARHNRFKDAPQQRGITTMLRRQNQQRLTVMLICICLLWLLLSGPYAIISSFIHNASIFVRTISYLLMYVNHAINFYIYCLTGKRFRFELKRMFGYQVYSTKKTRIQLPDTVSPPRRDVMLKMSCRSHNIELYK